MSSIRLSNPGSSTSSCLQQALLSLFPAAANPALPSSSRDADALGTPPCHAGPAMPPSCRAVALRAKAEGGQTCHSLHAAIRRPLRERAGEILPEELLKNPDVWFARILLTPPATRFAELVRNEQPRAMRTKASARQRDASTHDIDCSHTRLTNRIALMTPGTGVRC